MMEEQDDMDAAACHQQELEAQELEEQMVRVRKLTIEWLNECRIFDEYTNNFNERIRRIAWL